MIASAMRWLPAVPWLSRFAELNLRTYVRLDDRPGVYFFSLDASNPVAVSLARSLFSLPYFRARMTCAAAGAEIVYNSTRTHAGAPCAGFEGRYGPAGEVFRAEPGTLEHFLTERYCLYTSSASVGGTWRDLDRGDLYRGEIHHAPWPLQPARATIDVNSLLETVGAHSVTEVPSHLLFARSLDVRVWRLRKV